MSTEADTCRKYVLPKLIAAGWDDEPHSIAEQRTFTDGRIVVIGKKAQRQKQKRADYLLRYTHDFTLRMKPSGRTARAARAYSPICGVCRAATAATAATSSAPCLKAY